jgi:AcrR family transcriptional regulator
MTTLVTEASSSRAEGRKPLSRERVLLVALDVADRDGLEGLSMRRLGQELGVDAMALYRHVRNKDDLLDGIVEVIVGQIGRVAPRDDWKGSLREQVMAARGVMLRHPWARQVMEDRGTAGAATIGYIDGILAILHGGGFSLDLAHHTLHLLGSRILGFNQDIFEDKASEPPPPEAAEALARSLAPYPYVLELAGSVSHDGVLGACDDDIEFAFGLDLILEGLDRIRARDMIPDS